MSEGARHVCGLGEAGKPPFYSSQVMLYKLCKGKIKANELTEGEQKGMEGKQPWTLCCSGVSWKMRQEFAEPLIGPLGAIEIKVGQLFLRREVNADMSGPQVRQNAQQKHICTRGKCIHVSGETAQEFPENWQRARLIYADTNLCFHKLLEPLILSLLKCATLLNEAGNNSIPRC